MGGVSERGGYLVGGDAVVQLQGETTFEIGDEMNSEATGKTEAATFVPAGTPGFHIPFSAQATLHDGFTFGDLLGFVKACEARGASVGAKVTVRIKMGGVIKAIKVEGS